MKFAVIKNQPVLSLSGAEKLGFVDDVFIHPEKQQVLGFRVRRGGLMTHYEAVLLADVKSMGQDAIVVQDPSRLNAEAKFADFQNSLTADGILGAQILTESGQQVGRVSDLDFEPQSGAIQSYTLSGSIIDRLRHQDHEIPSDAVKSIGNKVLVVDNEVASV